MKKFINCSLIAATILMLGALTSNAQPQRGSSNKGGDHQEWFQKMKQERIAFFTSECKFTEAEAKAFWPVYDQIEEERREATKASMTAYMELSKALKDGKPDSEIDALLAKYCEASAQNITAAETVARYKKILPASKVAKVILAEEKFRQQQIHRLNGGQGGPQGGPQGGRPGGNFQGGGRPQQGGGRPGGNGGWGQEQDF